MNLAKEQKRESARLLVRASLNARVITSIAASTARKLGWATRLSIYHPGPDIEDRAGEEAGQADLEAGDNFAFASDLDEGRLDAVSQFQRALAPC